MSWTRAPVDPGTWTRERKQTRAWSRAAIASPGFHKVDPPVKQAWPLVDAAPGDWDRPALDALSWDRPGINPKSWENRSAAPILWGIAPVSDERFAQLPGLAPKLWPKINPFTEVTIWDFGTTTWDDGFTTWDVGILINDNWFKFQ
jgi:hypothetical protein